MPVVSSAVTLTTGLIGMIDGTNSLKGVLDEITGAADEEPEYIGKVYEKIESLIGEQANATRKEEIKDMERKVLQIETWLEDWGDDNVFQRLKGQEEVVGVDIISKLKPKGALRAYLVAAPIHVAILNEIALNDPHCDPGKSKIFKLAQDKCTEHIKHIDVTYTSIVDMRTKGMSHRTFGEDTGGWFSKPTAIPAIFDSKASDEPIKVKWDDTCDTKLDEYNEGHWGDEWAEQKFKEYKDNIVAKLCEDLGNPPLVIELLKKEGAAVEQNRLKVMEKANLDAFGKPTFPGGSWKQTAKHLKKWKNDDGVWFLKAQLEGAHDEWHEDTTKFVPGETFSNIDGKFVKDPYWA